MKEVNAFKCSYCDKLFSNENSCHSHEKKCHHNPSTRSCESCAFCAYTMYYDEHLQMVKIPFCIKNEEISILFKKSCIHYKSRGSSGVSRIIEVALTSCDITGQVERYLNVPFKNTISFTA